MLFENIIYYLDRENICKAKPSRLVFTKKYYKLLGKKYYKERIGREKNKAFYSKILLSPDPIWIKKHINDANSNSDLIIFLIISDLKDEEIIDILKKIKIKHEDLNILFKESIRTKRDKLLEFFDLPFNNDYFAHSLICNNEKIIKSYLEDDNFFLNNISARLAIEFLESNTLIELYEKGRLQLDLCSFTSNLAAKYNKLDLLKYLSEKKIKADINGLNYAAEKGLFNIFKYLTEEQFIEHNFETAGLANLNLNSNIVPYLIKRGKLKFNSFFIYSSIEKGLINNIKYIKNNYNYNFKLEEFNHALRYEQFDIVKYLHQNFSIKPNVQSFRIVIKKGNVSLFKLLETFGEIPFSENYIYDSIESENLEIIKYLAEEKIFRKNIYKYLTEALIVKYPYDKIKNFDLILDQSCIDIAISANNITVLKYLIEEKKLKIKDSNIYNVIDFGSKKIMRYLFKDRKITLEKIHILTALYKEKYKFIRFLIKELNYKKKDFENYLIPISYIKDLEEIFK